MQTITAPFPPAAPSKMTLRNVMTGAFVEIAKPPLATYTTPRQSNLKERVVRRSSE